MKQSYLLVKHLVAFGMAAACVHAQGFYWNTASASSMAMGGVYLPSQAGAHRCARVESRGLDYAGRPDRWTSASPAFSREAPSAIR